MVLYNKPWTIVLSFKCRKLPEHVILVLSKVLVRVLLVMAMVFEIEVRVDDCDSGVRWNVWLFVSNVFNWLLFPWSFESLVSVSDIWEWCT